MKDFLERIVAPTLIIGVVWLLVLVLTGLFIASPRSQPPCLTNKTTT